jgi:hypothetical protein
MNWSLLGCLRGRTNQRPSERRAKPPGPVRYRRSIRLEQLEGRSLLAYGDLPYGAMPDDTGEFMLGDVRVNVVFMESDPTMRKRDGSAGDNGSITFQLPGSPPTSQTINYTPENWSNWTPSALDSLRSKISSGLAWWRQALRTKFPRAPVDSLNFTIDWTYADNPVRTGYEPIARISDDFQHWMYDFLDEAGFNASQPTGGFSPDIRAFNNFTRRETNSDWAFTIFVVNDLNDPNDRFAQFTNLGSFSQAFAFAGGQFMVVPASRPFETFAHESGHMFWGLDEYMDTDLVFNPQTGQWEQTQTPDEYLKRRGYYNTQNLNAADNPTPGFIQADSIMTNGQPMQRAASNFTSAVTTLAMVGWKDSDNDGIMDVLDVPFDLSGFGQYDINTGTYYFNGATSVRTLPNLNPSGLQNDITINQIRAVEYSVDGGITWERHPLAFEPRTYQTSLSISFPVPDGQTTVKVRTVDTRTGVRSNEFTGFTDQPAPASPGVSGFVFSDDDGNGTWDAGEAPLPDYGIEVLDESGQPLDLLRWVEPSEWDPGTVLDSVGDGATLSAFGFDTGTAKSVRAGSTPLASVAGRVFTTTNNLNQTAATWNEDRKFRAEFGALQSNVSLHAYGGGAGSTFARFEAYGAGDNLLERITTTALSSNSLRLMAFNRPAADIKYAVAYGHANTSVVFDTLEWGPASSATSDSLGAYSLNSLPDGTYQVQVIPPSPSHVITTPPDGIASVTVSGGMSSGTVNFGVHIDESEDTDYHNEINPLNVDGDPQNAVSAIDAVMIINWINANPGTSELPVGGNPRVLGYLDVDNDGFCSAADAILVINYLNSPAGTPARGGGGGEGEVSAEAAANSSAEGETASGLAAVQAAAEAAQSRRTSSGPPRNAAEYYAENPLHFDEIPGTELPCSCSQCLGVAGLSASGSGKLADTDDAISADISPATSDRLSKTSRRLLNVKRR